MDEGGKRGISRPNETISTTGADTCYCWSIHRRAFTLVELMIAMAMAIFFILATMTLSSKSTQTYRGQERVADVQQSVRAAMELMVRDIRMAGYDPMAATFGSTAGIGILTATETTLQFSADLNADRIDNGGIENMTYFYDAENMRLRQQEGGGAFPQTFIESVSALSFIYLDADGDPTGRLDEIAAVVITLTVEDRDHKGDTFQRTLTTRVNCRNLRM